MNLVFELARSAQECAKHKSDMQDRRRRLPFFVMSLIPILASYVYVQMQQQQKYQSYYGLDFFGYLWSSTALGVTALTMSIWHFSLRVVGISLGIGLGLGFAGHVYDVLADVKDNDRGIYSASKTWNSTGDSPVPNLPKDAIKSALEDTNSYHFLMRSAGYSVTNGTLRAQMVRGSQALTAVRANNAKRELKCSRVSVYNFNKGKTASMRMKTMWPNLAPIVNESLAKLIEFVLRDYISSWYSKVDEHVVFNDADSSYTSRDQDGTPTLCRTIDASDKSSTVPAEAERTRKMSNLSDFRCRREDSHEIEDHFHFLKWKISPNINEHRLPRYRCARHLFHLGTFTVQKFWNHNPR